MRFLQKTGLYLAVVEDYGRRFELDFNKNVIYFNLADLQSVNFVDKEIDASWIHFLKYIQ